MWQETYQHFSQMAVLEIIAVITAMAYVILAAREHILCWPAALISTLLYTIIFYEFYLWMDSLLQVYYFAMAIYGFYCWRQTTNTVGKSNGGGFNEGNNRPVVLAIHQQSLITHLTAISLLAGLSLVLGYFMANHTPTSFPYLDATTTVFAVYATYLVTQKVLENWLYWIVIDLVSIYIYIEKGLTPTAMLFVVYVVVAVMGYFTWRAKLKRCSQSQDYFNFAKENTENIDNPENAQARG